VVFVEKVFFWEPEKKAIFQLTTEKILKNGHLPGHASCHGGSPEASDG
jgi:hypothetical protein